MSNDVIVLKLKNGTDLICRCDVDFKKGDDINIDNPLQLQTISEGGKIGVGMMPWMMASEDTSFIINEKDILTMGTPTNVMEKQYLSAITGLSL